MMKGKRAMTMTNMYEIGDEILIITSRKSGVYQIIDEEPGLYHTVCIACTIPGYVGVESMLTKFHVLSDGFLWEKRQYFKAYQEEKLKQVCFDREAPSGDYSDAFDILKSILGG